jgi:hypothetical protein
MQLLLGPWRLATTWFLSKRKMFLFFFLWLRDLEFSSFKKCVGKTIWANIWHVLRFYFSSFNTFTFIDYKSSFFGGS